MEEHSQARERRSQEQQESRREETRRSPERESLTTAGLTARALLAGAPLWDLPPANLEELASFLGNQGLGELLERRGLQVQEAAFRLPPEEPETSPFPVPEKPAVLVQAPEGLASGGASGIPFDPAGLLE